MAHRMDRMLFTRISGTWLGVLRIGFGSVMLYESLWFLGLLPFAPQSPNTVELLFSGDQVHWTFPYRDMPWARPLPEPWTTAVFVLLGIASVLVIAGIAYRLGAITVFVTFCYVNLMDASVYLNHFYLECLVALLMVFVPADRRYAVRWKRGSESGLSQVPGWTIGLFRAQVFLVYFYAGLAKLNPDWLAGEPLRRWLPHPTSAQMLDPLMGPSAMGEFRHWLGQEGTVLAIGYAGLLFDLSIGFLLIWRPTRAIAFVIAVMFHVANFILFDIGAFPLLAVLLTTVFLEPDWPERWARAVGWRERSRWRARGEPSVEPRSSFVFPLVTAWLVLQIAVPLRHFIIPGEVSWTEEGHRFSWHMKLRDKYPGLFLMEIVSPTTNSPTNHGASFAASIAPQRPGAKQADEVDRNTEHFAIRYRHVDATRVAWDQLPELVVTYEPIVGERILLNPLSKPTWSEASIAARDRWQSACGVPLKLHKTQSLEATFADLDRQLNQAVQQDVPEAAPAQQTLDELRLLHRELTQEARAEDLVYLQFRFQDTLRRLAGYRRWRKSLLAALWQTPPFACQGAPAHDAPFMVVANHTAMLPDDYACCRIERTGCPDLGETLVDLHQLNATSLRSLPEWVTFADYGGRSAIFWNFTHELHAGQIASLQTSPLLQHTYAEHVAERWQQWFGVRPRVRVTSYVKLNQHAMQPMVDSQVDLARAPRKRLGHHAWILPLRRSDDDSRDATSIARRHTASGT
jgi:vitamin K-dependent gamma-carboxylase